MKFRKGTPNRIRPRSRSKRGKGQRQRRLRERAEKGLSQISLAAAATANPQPESSNSQPSDGSTLKSSIAANITDAAQPTVPKVSKLTVPTAIQPAIPRGLTPVIPVVLKPTMVINPTKLTRLGSQSSESILPDLKNPNWSNKPAKKTYLKEDRFSQNNFSNATSASTTIDTVSSEAIFLSSFKVEPEDNSVADLFDDSAMDPSRPPESPWEFHPALRSLSWLIGCWKSITASASYPTMETVPYREEMQFFGTKQPVLQYKSETWHTGTEELMHFESGVLRVDPGLKMVAFIVAHNFGVAEVSEGTLCDRPILMLKSKSISRMSFTKNASVTEIVRSFELKGNILSSTVSMGTVMEPLQKHLVVKYAKVL